MSGYAIRVQGRGVVTTVNGAPLATYEQAEEAARFIREALLEECEIERLLLNEPAAASPAAAAPAARTETADE